MKQQLSFFDPATPVDAPPVRVLSLHQPFALFARLGIKKLETRHYHTKVRGTIAIQAADRRPKAAELATLQRAFEEIEEAELFRTVLDLLKDDRYYKSIQAVCQLTESLYMIDTRIQDPRSMPDKPCIYLEAQSPLERACGNWAQGRYAWKLEDTIATPEPIALSAGQGFRFLKDEAILAQLAELKAS
jgi:hypothetical protein